MLGKKTSLYTFFPFYLIQSHETQTNQSHFKMYFTTQNSCTYILASSGLETQLTEAVGDGECYHLMLLYAYHISIFFLQLAAQRSLLRNIPAPQMRSKKSQVAMGE